MSKIHEILKSYWGYDSFRPMQEDIIASVLSGHDTLGLLPTGGGKSITFQVPAIALGGLCIVVTPLISLMKDQIDHLIERGIKAASVFMGMSHQEVLETYERVIDEHYQFLYLSPERIETQLFQAKLYYMDVRLLVVDEAHCISQWGYDFRPSYLKIAEIRKSLNKDVPCLALTATATSSVIKDIQKKLQFGQDSKVFRASFERPNLTYSVVHAEDKLGLMLELLNPYKKDETEQSSTDGAIIYVRSRKKTKDVAEILIKNNIPANYYHAGLSSSDKDLRQNEWMKGLTPVIVATNAFGMGIDKPNVRLVIHLDLPPSPEEYFQEAGRAGRDLLPSKAYILVDSKDKLNLMKHLSDEYPDRDYIRNIYSKLASYYQIAIGAGYNSMFEFDLMKFCSIYRLAVSPTYYSLKMLHQAGYIVFNEEPDLHSRVMFTTTRASLNHIDNFDKDSQKVINALLRLYTGIFADFVFIREEDIMFRSGLTREVLYEKLLLLSRFHVLHYVPARQKPAIIYLTPRLENEEIRIPHTIYEDRKKRQEERINAMIRYVDNSEECRMVQLLKYFDEEIDHSCNSCDVCKSKSSNFGGNTEELKLFLEQTIYNILKLNPNIPVVRVIEQIHYDSKFTSSIIREMIVLGKLELKNNLLILK